MIEKISEYLAGEGFACSPTDSPNIICAADMAHKFLVSVWTAPTESPEFLAAIDSDDDERPHPYHWNEEYWNAHRAANGSAAKIAEDILNHMVWESHTNTHRAYEWWNMPYSTAYVIFFDPEDDKPNRFLFLVEKI